MPVRRTFPDVRVPLSSGEQQNEAARERGRVLWLRRHRMLEGGPDAQLDRISQLAAGALGRPFAGITLLDADRLFIKSHVGSIPLEVPRQGSPCELVIVERRRLTLTDAQADARFAKFVSIAGTPGFRYWSGVPVATSEGHVVGALWVADTAPDAPPAEEHRILTELARLAQLHLDQVEMQREQRRDRQIASALERAEILSCCLLSPDGTVRSWNAGAVSQFGVAAEDAIGRKFWELPIGAGDDVFEAIQQVLAGEARRTEAMWHARDGRRIDLSVRWSPVFDDDGAVEAILVVAVDVTASKRAHERDMRRIRVLEAVARFEPLGGVIGSIVHSIEAQFPGCVAMVDIVRDNRLERVARSQNLPAILAAPPSRPIVRRDRTERAQSEVVLRNAAIVSPDVAADPLWATCGSELVAAGFRSAWSLPISAQGACRGVVTVLSPESRAPSEAEVAELESGTTLIAVIVGRYDDRERLVHLANFDSLTGLANREVAFSRLRDSIATEAARGGRAAVAVLDLNGFKKLNDTYGHHVGDRVLQSVARSLETSLGSRGMVARMSGDEFLLILNGIESIGQANLCVERALCACRAGAIVDGHKIGVDAAVGISFSSPENCDPERLIREADRAMYVAKRSGISQAVFSRDMLSRVELRTADLARDLAAAIEHGKLFVAYQPEVDLGDGRIVGVEALARWDHPRHGRISPEVFIPIAEATNQIAAIGDFVLETALRDARRWQRPGRPLRIALNLSSHQLEERDFVNVMLERIARAGFDRNLVDLEIAERLLVNSSRASAEALRALKAAGPRVVVDDFGSGRANLTYLRDFPLDVLKLDRSFSAPLGSEAELASRAVVAGLVTMAHMMNVRIVAEGVDLPAQLRSVRELGCDAVQGDLIVSAVSAERVGRLLAEDQPLLAPIGGAHG
jgi:diguanylate cyclase (GGDEF)-like protein/PAS domain S-box-containing protein